MEPEGVTAASVPLDLQAEVQKVSGFSLPYVTKATDMVLGALDGADVSALEHKNLGFKGYDWRAYLRLSAIRLGWALEALRRHGAAPLRILDYGSYFGNFSLAAAFAGHHVEAFDSYAEYGGAFAQHRSRMLEAGVSLLEAGDVGYELQGLAENTYDVVLMMGVVEHIPNSPRAALEGIKRVLKPGGVFVLDKPNLGYIYTRRRLAMGGTVFPPVATQYLSQTPFSGHHRENTIDEVRWIMGEALGLEEVAVDTFNYSLFGLSELGGLDLALWRLMERSPSLRELIFAVGRKPA
jgi:2-polyprenyl-3-methyl-5-hydroxy-6-metoxy-1,4-benzoquinol methylase